MSKSQKNRLWSNVGNIIMEKINRKSVSVAHFGMLMYTREYYGVLRNIKKLGDYRITMGVIG